MAHTTDVPVQIVRLGQTCGDRNGHWNETEWLPIVVKSALSVGCLPDMDGVSAYIRCDTWCQRANRLFPCRMQRSCRTTSRRARCSR